MLPPGLTSEDKIKVLQSLPIENDLVDVYENTTLLVSGLPISDISDPLPDQKDVPPSNKSIEEVFDDIKDQNIIPVVTNANLPIIKTLEEDLPMAKISTIVIEDIPEELETQVSKVPSIEALNQE